MTRFWEDIETGVDFPLGEHTFTAEEIVAFGKAWDPQYFHTDPEAALHSHFGSLVASGWHTLSVGHRKMVDALDAEAARLRELGTEPGVSGPSPGINYVHFHLPVRPGDTLTYVLTVDRKRPSKSLPGWGLLFNHIDATNQGGHQVYSAEVVAFTRMRHAPLGARLQMALARIPGLKALARRR
jgi:acyl dehydratase